MINGACDNSVWTWNWHRMRRELFCYIRNQRYNYRCKQVRHFAPISLCGFVLLPSAFGNGGSESKSASFAPNFANNGLMTSRCVTQARVPSMNPIKACVRMNTRTLCNVLVCQSESIGSKRAPAKITHDGIALFGTHGHFFNANPSARQNTNTSPHFGIPPRLFKN